MKARPRVSFLQPWARLARLGLRSYHAPREPASHKYPRIQDVHGGAPRMRVPEFRKTYESITREAPAGEEVVLCGRVQTIRRAGSKLYFVPLINEFEQVQIMCNWRALKEPGPSEDEFKALFRALNRGDIICGFPGCWVPGVLGSRGTLGRFRLMLTRAAVMGRAIRTPTGELTLEATCPPVVLAPCLVPLPYKLDDEETRMQNRHVDLLVNKSTADVFRLRPHVVRHLREFFQERGFLEAHTPVLAERADGASARPFTTRSTELPDSEPTFRIAPELWLKRAVVGGFDRVFELGPSFRNEGVDSTHNPEFTMCEFYETYASLADLMAHTEELLTGLAASCGHVVATQLTALPPVDVSRYQRPFRTVEFIPALEAALQFRLPDLSSPTALSDLLALLEARQVDVPETSRRSLPALLDRLAGTCGVEESGSGSGSGSGTGTGLPLFVTHHPACMSPLAKSFTCPTTGQAVSARAELFVGGRELANMYEEENDPAAQRPKMADQGPGPGPGPVNERYLVALGSGLPPTGGWGCGVDRLVMLFSGAHRIADVLTFGTLRHVMNSPAWAKKEVEEQKKRNKKEEGEK